MNNTVFSADCFLRTGLRHIEASEPCQDSVRVFCVKRDDMPDLIYLGDGVSSCKDSGEASKQCGEAVFEAFGSVCSDREFISDLTSPDPGLRDKTLRFIAGMISSRCRNAVRYLPYADTTLTFVYLVDERYAVAGYIGDSAVIIFKKDEAAVLSQTRDYGGATESIRNPSSAELMDVRLIDMKKDGVIGFLLTSDGLEEILYTKGRRQRALKSCESFLNSMFEDHGHERIEELLDEICEDGYFDDDISVALLACAPVKLPDDPTWLCSCGHRNNILSSYCEKCDKDYFTLYRNADMSAFESPWEYFEYLNAHPDEERKAAGFESEPKARDEAADESENDRKGPEDDPQEGRRSADCEDITVQADPRGGSRGGKDDRNARDYRVTDDRGHKGRSRASVPVSIIAIGASVTILLCGLLAVSFFQMLSISNTVEELKAEIDSMKDSGQVSAAADNAATPDEAAPTEAALSKAPTEASQPPSDRPEQTGLSVSGTTTLYPGPGYDNSVIGYAVTDDSITLLEVNEIDGVEWARIETSSGVIGWAPYEFFTVTAIE